MPTTDVPAMPQDYNPSKVGNDAAARPWEATPASFVAEVANAAQAHHAEDALIRQMRDYFIEMQRAWDNADVAGLRAMMTRDLADLLGERLLERADQGPSDYATEIVVLEAHLLSHEQTQAQSLLSVEFSGMVRESPTQAPAPFREIWDLVQARQQANARWLVAGVQSLQ